MTSRYIAYNGIVFGAESFVARGRKVEYTPYIFAEFEPNDISTVFQKDDLITDGSIYSNFKYEPRVVSLRGYILPRKGESLEELRIALYEKCNGKTASELLYESGNHTYITEAVADAPVTAKRVANSAEFNINFTLPGFFWYQKEAVRVGIYATEGNIPIPFTMPRTFGHTVSKAKIINTNGFDIYPKIKITSRADNTIKSLTVTNAAIDCTVTATELSIPPNGEVVIDCLKLTAFLGDTSVIDYFNDFDGFLLAPGTNEISCTHSGGYDGTQVIIEYYRPFVGI